ncbi:hypothetical protein R9C00_11450 [Flammeovirgaceae bacterium SG7u.111]|nr:hypothetical protein [Flammeovirgaceae bacterium SG7u.132]WPO38067.1 hypothetical protein R9C00_11450 [Flammeovirgaceae bacterium SG7u.111]
MNKISLLSILLFLLFVSFASGQERYKKIPWYYWKEPVKLPKVTRYGKPYKSVKVASFRNLGSSNGISLMANYESLGGSLGVIWHAGIGLNGSYIIKRDRNIYSASVGWNKFKPIDESYANLVAYTGDAKFYGEYNVIPVLVGYAFELPLRESGFSLLPGIDAGLRFSNYSYSTGTELGDETGNVSESQFTLAPKLELEYHITGNLSITARSRYNVFFSRDKNTEFLTGTRNTRKTLTNGLGLVFYF